MAKGGRRRGRKRKPGDRYPSGRLIASPAVDKGTPELQERRRTLAGGPEKDAALASSVTGVLLVNRMISRAEYDAGNRYAWLFGVATGLVTTPAAARYGAVRGGAEHNETWLEARTAEYWRLARYLIGVGRQYKAAVESAVVFDVWPRWLASEVAAARAGRARSKGGQSDDLVLGLALLAGELGFQQRAQKLAA